jgi:membrane protease YdiL (CAAX protease family)
MMKKIEKRSFLRWLLLVIFLLRYLFDAQIAGVNLYAPYLIEIGLVGLAAFSFASLPAFKLKVSPALVAWFVVSLISGFAVFKIAGLAKITVPFDFTSKETLLFLLIVAPILEELLFRFSYCLPFEKKGFNVYTVGAISATLFSLSHLNAIRYVPEEFFSFVYYQTCYTFILGFFCYLLMQRFNRDLSASILLHFFFNLGFFISAL